MTDLPEVLPLVKNPYKHEGYYCAIRMKLGIKWKLKCPACFWDEDKQAERYLVQPIYTQALNEIKRLEQTLHYADVNILKLDEEIKRLEGKINTLIEIGEKKSAHITEVYVQLASANKRVEELEKLEYHVSKEISWFEEAKKAYAKVNELEIEVARLTEGQLTAEENEH
jgi:chromosome segregation ATPase